MMTQKAYQICSFRSSYPIIGSYLKYGIGFAEMRNIG